MKGPRKQSVGVNGSSVSGGSSSVQQQQQQQQASGAGAAAAAAAASPHPPSKVVHLRGLPPYATEADVVHLFAAMAGLALTRILLLPNSSQAFLQLATVEQAQQLMHMQAQQGGLNIKGAKTAGARQHALATAAKELTH